MNYFYYETIFIQYFWRLKQVKLRSVQYYLKQNYFDSGKLKKTYETNFYNIFIIFLKEKNSPEKGLYHLFYYNIPFED